MDTSHDGCEFADFIVEVVDTGRPPGPTHISKQRAYRLCIDSTAGALETTIRFPFSAQELESCLVMIEKVLLNLGQRRRGPPGERQCELRAFGRALFHSLLPAGARGLYYDSKRHSEHAGKGLRVKLRIGPPELASLPWELMFDSRQAAYVGLSTVTPIVRDLGLVESDESIAVEPPLRILGMVANPSGLVPLDLEREQKRVEEALFDLRKSGTVELRWLERQTWRDLLREIRRERFNVFHFVGHGGFNPDRGEGLIVLASDSGAPHYLPATDLAMLLADEQALRLAVLNSCDGARGSSLDVFSSSASILVRNGGVPAVVAMQYEITDHAAIEFARTFYEAVADGVSVEAAVGGGRQAVRLANPGTFEWATPVLYMSASNGILFNFRDLTSWPRPHADRAVLQPLLAS